VVMMQRGYETRRISNHAPGKYQIRKMASQGDLWQDAVGLHYAGGWTYFLCADFFRRGIRPGFMMRLSLIRMMRGTSGAWTDFQGSLA